MHTYVNTSHFGLWKVQRKDLHNLLAICFQWHFHSLFTCDRFTLINIYLPYNYRCVSHPTSLEGFITAILAHRGYPVCVLNGLMILQSALPNTTSNDCKPYHSKAELQSQRRHDARVERALKLSTKNELARVFGLNMFRRTLYSIVWMLTGTMSNTVSYMSVPFVVWKIANVQVTIHLYHIHPVSRLCELLMTTFWNTLQGPVFVTSMPILMVCS